MSAIVIPTMPDPVKQIIANWSAGDAVVPIDYEVFLTTGRSKIIPKVVKIELVHVPRAHGIYRNIGGSFPTGIAAASHAYLIKDTTSTNIATPDDVAAVEPRPQVSIETERWYTCVGGDVAAIPMELFEMDGAVPDQ